MYSWSINIFYWLQLKKTYITLIAQKHTEGHSEEAVSENIKEVVLYEYPDVDLPDNVWEVVSDTTAAAWDVVDHFDEISQNDCAIHGGILSLQYAIGLLETVKTVNRIKHTTTPGSKNEFFSMFASF